MNDHPAFTDERPDLPWDAGIVQGGSFTTIKRVGCCEIWYDGEKVGLKIYYLNMDNGVVGFYLTDDEGQCFLAECRTEIAKSCRVFADPSKLEVRPIPID